MKYFSKVLGFFPEKKRQECARALDAVCRRRLSLTHVRDAVFLFVHQEKFAERPSVTQSAVNPL